MSEIGLNSDKATCVCVYEKQDPFGILDITVGGATGGRRHKRLVVLSWFADMEERGRELIDEDMDWADVIAYAEAKWRSLQKETDGESTSV